LSNSTCLDGSFAESFARIFFGNAIAIGLPIITCPKVSGSFAEEDELELDLTNAKVTNVTEQKTLNADGLCSRKGGAGLCQ